MWPNIFLVILEIILSNMAFNVSKYPFYNVETWTRVEAPTTDHLRDYVPNLEKYKAVQTYPRCRTMEISKTTFFWGNLIP